VSEFGELIQYEDLLEEEWDWLIQPAELVTASEELYYIQQERSDGQE